MIVFNDRRDDEYFEWMYDLVCDGRFSKRITYRKLLMHLHNTEFIYSIPRDENRAEGGVDLRRRFSDHNVSGPCSVLEMMLALAIDCEETIMENAAYGDRTGQWFWGMINNLGLGTMNDTNYDREYVTNILDRFLHRRYERDGRGGLFTVRNCDRDLRDVEIWYQLCWYLDSIPD